MSESYDVLTSLIGLAELSNERGEGVVSISKSTYAVSGGNTSIGQTRYDQGCPNKY